MRGQLPVALARTALTFVWAVRESCVVRATAGLRAGFIQDRGLSRNDGGREPRESTMQDNSERDLMEPQGSEIHDLSLGTFRFLSVLFAAAFVLLIAGVI